MEIVRILYPKRCPVCEEILPDIPGMSSWNVCEKCNKKLHYIHSPRCFICGKQLYDAKEEYCSDCKTKTHIFTQGVGVFGYDEQIKDVIYRFKYSQKKEYAKFFADSIVIRYGHQIRRWNIDAVIPIPLHWLKYLKRGYNQAELIAKEISHLLDIPLDSGLLIRNRFTKPMKELNDEERVKNLENAFQLSANIVKYKKVLLVDDIYTTGATIDACSSVLKQAGVEQVYFASVCIGNGY